MWDTVLDSLQAFSHLILLMILKLAIIILFYRWRNWIQAVEHRLPSTTFIATNQEIGLQYYPANSHFSDPVSTMPFQNFI